MRRSVDLAAHEAFEQQVGETVRETVLRRDMERCQVCGTHRDLQLHHWLHFRSQGGDDSVANLVTVCPKHHEWIHAGKIDVLVLGEAVFVDRRWK